MSATQPYVMISYSDDAGMTFSHEIKKPLVGADKNYLNRVRLFRQGSAFNRVYRLRYSEYSNFTLVEAFADIQVGT